MDRNDLNTAVILSGGGAYGAYEVGVMKALVDGKSPATGYTPIDPGIFTGTSVGAVNASVLVSQSTTDITSAIANLQHIWLDEITDRPGRCGNGIYRFRADPFRYLDPECLLRDPLRLVAELSDDGNFLSRDFFKRGFKFLSSQAPLEQRALELFTLSSFISVQPFRQLLGQVVNLEAIRKSEKVLRIATTNWATGDVRIFSNEDMTEEIGYQAILASTAIPGFFPPHRIQGDPYVDGGVVTNTPLQCAIDAGANMLHVIYLDPDIKDTPLVALEDTIDTLEKLYSIMSATIAGEDAKTAKWINEGLEVIERTTEGGALSDADVLAFVRVAGQIEKRLKQGTQYRKLTVHQYRPRNLLGGSLGLLDFRRDVISGLIDRGFTDAVEHDCEVNDCVLPHEIGVARAGMA